MPHAEKSSVLIFVVAYNAEKKIESVLDRIPAGLAERYRVHVLIADDCSQDDTAQVAKNRLARGYWCTGSVLRHPVNQGYGGNQKIGYQYAIDHEFDLVVLLHGDGQYAPEAMPTLLEPFDDANTSAVFGSRMLNKRDALKGGMPYYKYVGNQVLTHLQNLLLGTSLSEFHTGYRIYSVRALKAIPFRINTDDFHFDTEIIVQLVFAGERIVELPIPTFYGDEVCHVDGMKYAGNVMKSSLKARLVRMGIFFDPKFAVMRATESRYVSKFDFKSTHSVAFSRVAAGSTVLDMGCADGYLSEKLHAEKNCTVFSSDLDAGRVVAGCTYSACNLNDALPDVPWESLDWVVLLDVIEHLHDPEGFLARLRDKLSGNTKVRIIVSSGNVCFFVTRMMMLLGQFNYGPRGILDITHTRLFTVKSLARLLRYAAYRIERRDVVPAPYPLAIGLNPVSRFLVAINGGLARIWPGMFAYQSIYEVTHRGSTASLLRSASKVMDSVDDV